MQDNERRSEEPDDLDVLSSIWILSCNDENPIITYEGLKYRLNAPPRIDVEKLVKSRGELFRQKVPERRLEEWKQQMREGKHLPSFLRDIENPVDRKQKIEALSVDGVFRNQFRAESDAPRTEIEILDWGLQHIDRIRKARTEAREKNFRQWSGKWLPLISTLTALAAVLSAGFFQYQSLETQARLKYYEVELRPKQDGYDQFMKSVIQAGDHSFQSDHSALVRDLTDMELAYYKLEPFLAEVGKTNLVWQLMQDFSQFCYSTETAVKSSGYVDAYGKRFLEYKTSFRRELSQIF